MSGSLPGGYREIKSNPVALILGFGLKKDEGEKTMKEYLGTDTLSVFFSLDHCGAFFLFTS